MTQLTRLWQVLQSQLPWHGARLTFIGLFLIALFRVKTVNLAELAIGFMGTAQIDSHYKRLQRFFREFEVDYQVVATTVMNWMNIPQPWVLSIDRTEWSFGEYRFNILILGIVHQGIAIPVVWSLLHKKGSSNGTERMDLLDRFGKYFPSAKSAELTADREFLAQEWFSYLLLEPTIPFRIRIRDCHKISNRSATSQGKGAVCRPCPWHSTTPIRSPLVMG